MIRLNSSKRKILILFASLSLFLTSCYSDYVHISSDVEYSSPRPVSQFGDSNIVAFVSKQKAYLRATGITAFPNGGQVKVIYKKTGLYVFNTETKTLSLIKDLTNSEYAHRNFREKTHLLFVDSLIYSNTIYKGEAKDSLLISRAGKSCWSINIYSKQKNIVDTAKFNTLYQKYYEKKKVDLTGLKTVPLSEFGINIQEIYPKSDEDYIEETIYLTSDGQTTRRAVIEQIISKLDRKEIKNLIRKMDEYKNSLEGYEKSKYEIYSEETYQSLQELL